MLIDNEYQFVEESLVPEIVYNDEVFRNPTFGAVDNIVESYEYNRPDVKTWLYSNMEQDVWASDGIVPFKIKKDKNSFNNLKIFKKGILIIKSYELKVDNINEYSDIIKILIESNVISELKTKVISFLESKLDPNFLDKSKLRLIYFINEDNILYNKNIKFKNFIFSTNSINIISKETKEDITISDNELLLMINYKAISGHPIQIDICGSKINVYDGREDKNDECKNIDHIGLRIKTRDKLINYGTYLRDKFDGSWVNNVTDNYKILGSYLDTKFAFNKLIYDHSVSLHKLFSYIVREEAGILGIEKEEISVAKEMLKLLPIK